MQLSNCELLPGVIVDTNDDLRLGRIKCVIPGYVDASFSNENMPWVRPLGMFNHQSFSKMMKGYKVWILVNKSNYNEYWYFPFFELNDVAKSYLDPVYDSDQPEVLVCHNCGGNHATLTYDEKNGYSEKIGQHHIDLHPEGKISIQGGDGLMEISGSKIRLGNVSGNDQKAVLGKNLLSVLNELKGAMKKLQGLCVGQTEPLAEGFLAAEEALEKATTEYNILSENITVN